MKMDGKFCFVSKGEPAAKHDKERLEQYQRMIIDNLGENESIVMDKGFSGFVPEQPKGQWLIMKKRPKHGKFSKEERRRNKEINLVRRPIEKELGDISSRFAIFSVKYRHDQE
jgi:hypothetical protein